VPEQNNYFIIAAFVVTWLCVVGYAVFLLRARRVADQRLVEAQRMFGGKS
jgi:CcmD family protein